MIYMAPNTQVRYVLTLITVQVLHMKLKLRINGLYQFMVDEFSSSYVTWCTNAFLTCGVHDYSLF